MANNKVLILSGTNEEIKTQLENLEYSTGSRIFSLNNSVFVITEAKPIIEGE